MKQILLMFWFVDVFKLFQNFVSLKTLIDQNKRNEQNFETAWKHQHIKNKRNDRNSETAWKHQHTKNKRNEQFLKQLENINRPNQRERNKY